MTPPPSPPPFPHVLLRSKRLVQTRAGGADYRGINVRMQYYTAAARYRLTVSRAAFYPQPRVDAGLVELRLRRPEELSRLTGAGTAAGGPPEAQQRAFFAMVDAAFLSRRKMLRNSLVAWSPDAVTAGLRRAGLSELARPQDLDAPAFVALFNALPSPDAGKVVTA